MASDPIVANRRLASFVTACAAALVLAGCQTTGPPRDPAILSGIPEAKTNASALFTSLQQPPPACTASANAAGFGKVESNLGGLKSAADMAPMNRFSQAGFAKLQSSFAAFRQGVTAGGANCTPARIVTDFDGTFSKALDDLLAHEQAKKEAR